MNKQESRKISIKRINTMSDSEKEWASDVIVDAITNLEQFKKCHNIFIFMSNELEPNTHELIGLSLMMEKNVSVPKIFGTEMKAIMITPYTLFKKNKYNIEEPVTNVELENVDVVIVPMIAFDGVNRVGHGKGYYDKFLEKTNCYKIGIAYSCQEITNIEFEKNDIPLDLVITEKNIINKTNREANIFGEEL